jgi:hypothetical protein
MIEKIVIMPIYCKVQIYIKIIKLIIKFNLMKYLIIDYIWVCPISILYEQFQSCDFIKKHLNKFFIPNLKNNYHLKNNKNYVERFVLTINFQCFSKN